MGAGGVGAVGELWARFRAATGVGHDRYDVFAFGDNPRMSDDLAELVLHGPKRATAGLLADFEHDGEPVPVEGGYSVVVDGRGAPVAVLRTTEVTVKAFGEVDAAFARDEGEGDRTLEWWLAAHRRFFARRCAVLGIDYSDDLATVFVRFELGWPVDPAP